MIPRADIKEQILAWKQEQKEKRGKQKSNEEKSNDEKSVDEKSDENLPVKIDPENDMIVDETD